MADMYRECTVCGKEFKTCNTCHKSVPEYLQWRRVVCCPQHFSFHLPIIRYVRKEISREEAKSELENAIKNFGEVEYAEDIKAVVNEIMAEAVEGTNVNAVKKHVAEAIEKNPEEEIEKTVGEIFEDKIDSVSVDVDLIGNITDGDNEADYNAIEVDKDNDAFVPDNDKETDLLVDDSCGSKRKQRKSK